MEEMKMNMKKDQSKKVSRRETDSLPEEAGIRKITMEGKKRNKSRPKRGEGRQAKRRVLRCTAAAMAVFTLALQPCFRFPALADSYGNGYPYWDDPEYGSYSYWDEETNRKIVNVTRTYDDGTKNISVYQYDAQGNLISSSIQNTDGSRTTVDKVYHGDDLISETSYQYHAGNQTETTERVDYGYLLHRLRTVRYEDKTSESEEEWCLGRETPLKKISTTREGITSQTDYVYNDQWQLSSSHTVSSDGSESQEERQYGADGSEVYSKSYTYYSSTREARASEIWSEGGSRTHTIDTETYADGKTHTVEEWYEKDGWQPAKRITTEPDGNQTTENYTYDSEGYETLYTKVGSDGTSEKRQTVYSRNRIEKTYTDRMGNVSTTLTLYDENQGKTTREYTEKNEDGSSSYIKIVDRADYTTESYESRERTADGKETYVLITYGADGNATKREKNADGSVTETCSDGQGNVTIKKILPDGTKAEVTQVKRADGQLASEITLYSDGSEDRSDYLYDENGEETGKTETRRNGVSAVTQYQYDGGEEYGAFTQIFNNGLQFTVVSEKIDENTVQFTVTYSGGDIAQELLIDKDDVSLYVKTVYRDGRTEEAAYDMSGADKWKVRSQALEPIESRLEDYIEQCWNILP